MYRSPTTYNEARIHAAAVYCSDGRVGNQIDDFLHHGLGLPRYDRLACTGGPACLSGRFLAYWETQGLEQQLRFLHRVHQLREVVLIAHEGCAYYRDRLGIPAGRIAAEQKEDLVRAAVAVRGLDAALAVSGYLARIEGTAVVFEPASVGEAAEVLLTRT